MKKELLVGVALSLFNLNPSAATAEVREFFACVGNSPATSYWTGRYRIQTLPHQRAEIEYCAWRGSDPVYGQVQRPQQAQIIPEWLRIECVTQFVTSPTPQAYLEQHAQEYLRRHYPCENLMAFGERFNPQQQQQPQSEISPHTLPGGNTL